MKFNRSKVTKLTAPKLQTLTVPMLRNLTVPKLQFARADKYFLVRYCKILYFGLSQIPKYFFSIRNPPSDLIVRCGDWDTKSTSEPMLHQDRRVRAITRHPSYFANRSVQANALLKRPA